MRERRYDIGELRPPADLPNGWLRADAFVTRAGVFVYRNPDGSERRELRHPEDVFDPGSLATLAMVPVTDGHPSVPLDATNARSLSVGHLGERVERAEGDLVRASLLLVDAPAIDAVRRDDRRELSCGYDADVVEEAGTYEGEPYTHRQRAIVYNHVAIVPMGRAGPLVRLRVDGEERLVPVADGAVQVHVEGAHSKPGVGSEPSKANDAIGGRMPVKVRRYDVNIELEDSQVAALDAMLEKVAKDSTAQLDDMRKRLGDALKAAKDAETAAGEKAKEAEAAEAEKDKAQAKADALEAELKKARDPSAVANRVAERVALVAKAQPVLGAETKLDALSDHEIRKAVAEKLSGTKLDGKSDAYVEARFDAEVERHDAAAGELAGVRRAAQAAGGGENHLDEADRKFHEATQNAWKQPLGIGK